MISRAMVALLLLTMGCPIAPPPPPRPIVCDEIDRAEERFPAECGEEQDAGPDAESTAEPAAEPASEE